MCYDACTYPHDLIVFRWLRQFRVCGCFSCLCRILLRYCTVVTHMFPTNNERRIFRLSRCIGFLNCLVFVLCCAVLASISYKSVMVLGQRHALLLSLNANASHRLRCLLYNSQASAWKSGVVALPPLFFVCIEKQRRLWNLFWYFRTLPQVMRSVIPDVAVFT